MPSANAQKTQDFLYKLRQQIGSPIKVHYPNISSSASVEPINKGAIDKKSNRRLEKTRGIYAYFCRAAFTSWAMSLEIGWIAFLDADQISTLTKTVSTHTPF